MEVKNWLICTTSIPPYKAGAGQNAFRFAEFLYECNQKVTILTFKKKDNLNYPNTKVKLCTSALPKENALSRLIFRLRFPFFAYKAIRKAHIIYMVGLIPGHQILVRIAKLYNKKIILRSTLLGADNMVALTSQNPRIKGFITKHTLSKLDGYIAINKSFMNDWVKIFPNKANQSILSTQGVNTNIFRPIPQKDKILLRNSLNIHNQNIPIIISVGNLSTRKGYDTIFEVLSEIEQDFLYIVVGDTNEFSKGFCHKNNTKVTLANYGKELLGNKIIFKGYNYNPEIFYQISDIFIGFSNQEGLPNAILEAMSCKLPVIYSNLEGVTGWITTPDNSIICNSSTEFKNAIVELIESREKREYLGANGRKMAEEMFSFNRFLQEITYLCRNQ